jgi:uncharacterized membrane protein (UPF0127 family)
MKRFFTVLPLLGLLFVGKASAQAMPQMELSAGIHRIVAEVAASDLDRQRGLMQRTGLGPNQGMLFVFPQAGRHCMWMKNTLIALSVAFIGEDGKIINIADMQPQTEINHCAEAPARYALEMTQGWFRSRGLAAGVKLNGIDKAPGPR